MSYQDLLTRFKDLRALVVGDLMLDEYIFGRATRISPEAPVMVIRQQSTNAVPGGAANVAKNIRALGADAKIVGVIGCDAAGERLETAMLQDGSAALVRDPNRATTRKTRVLADHAHQVLRIDHEDDEPIQPETEDRLLAMIEECLPEADVVLVSDYLKGTATERVVRGLIGMAGKTPVVVNPKPRSAALFAGATLVSLNRAEASEALGEWRGIADEDAIDAAERLRKMLGVSSVLITLGEGGMAVAGESQFRVEAPKVEVYDTAGAGDTVIATVALGLAAGGLQREVFELAAQTAASVVRKVGVATPSADDLRRLRG